MEVESLTVQDQSTQQAEVEIYQKGTKVYLQFACGKKYEIPYGSIMSQDDFEKEKEYIVAKDSWKTHPDPAHRFPTCEYTNVKMCWLSIFGRNRLKRDWEAAKKAYENQENATDEKSHMLRTTYEVAMDTYKNSLMRYKIDMVQWYDNHPEEKAMIAAHHMRIRRYASLRPVPFDIGQGTVMALTLQSNGLKGLEEDIKSLRLD
jgi:hypothetical protein